MLPLKDHQPSGIFPIVTIGLIIANIIVFGFEIFTPDLEAFIFRFALVPAEVNFTDPSTLTPFITSIFLHGSILHLLSNMWFLGIFGDNVEASLGKLKFLIFYLVGGVVAGVAQFLLSMDSPIPILGASGAIAGVMGFYMIRFPHHTVKTLVPSTQVISTVDMPSQIVIGVWFVLQLFYGTSSLVTDATETSGVAWWAHIGGFVYGAMIGLIYNKLTKKRIG